MLQEDDATEHFNHFGNDTERHGGAVQYHALYQSQRFILSI